MIDMTEPTTLTMPETNDRYQSAWIITDEHYNPMAFVQPGTYGLTQENVGRLSEHLRREHGASDADPQRCADGGVLVGNCLRRRWLPARRFLQHQQRIRRTQ